MSRQKYEKTFNTFTKGLMTEASELNFPEDFSLYEKNFLLHRDGGRDRRKGMELVYPLGMTLTSTPYPIEFDDSLTSSASIANLVDKAVLINKDSGNEILTLQSASLTGVQFRSVLFDMDSGVEGASLLCSVGSMRLHSVMVPHSEEGERVSLGAEVDSIRLHKQAVDYTAEIEQVNLSVEVGRIYLHES